MLVFGTCPEALKSGTVLLVGTNHDLIVSDVSTLLDDAQANEHMSKAVNPYGDGKACRRIVRALKGEQVDRYEVKLILLGAPIRNVNRIYR